MYTRCLLLSRRASSSPRRLSVYIYQGTLIISLSHATFNIEGCFLTFSAILGGVDLNLKVVYPRHLSDMLMAYDINLQSSQDLYLKNKPLGYLRMLREK